MELLHGQYPQSVLIKLTHSCCGDLMGISKWKSFSIFVTTWESTDDNQNISVTNHNGGEDVYVP